MEFIRPDQIAPSSVFRSLREDLDGLRAEIDAARPLPEGVVSRIANELRQERVHQSNAIEGNTLSFRETVRILESGQLFDVGKKRESLETLNLGKAIGQIQDCLDAQIGYADEGLFLAVHKILFTELRDDIAGCFRWNRVAIRGANHDDRTGVDRAILSSPTPPAPAGERPLLQVSGRSRRGRGGILRRVVGVVPPRLGTSPSPRLFRRCRLPNHTVTN